MKTQGILDTNEKAQSKQRFVLTIEYFKQYSTLDILHPFV